MHKVLKTEEEHATILAKLAENRKIPSKARTGILPVSGLFYCAKCGHRMRSSRGRFNGGTGKKYYTALCVYTHPDGTKCTQRGRKLDDDFYKQLFS